MNRSKEEAKEVQAEESAEKAARKQAEREYKMSLMKEKITDENRQRSAANERKRLRRKAREEQKLKESSHAILAKLERVDKRLEEVEQQKQAERAEKKAHLLDLSIIHPELASLSWEKYILGLHEDKEGKWHGIHESDKKRAKRRVEFDAWAAARARAADMKVAAARAGVAAREARERVAALREWCAESEARIAAVKAEHKQVQEKIRQDKAQLMAEMQAREAIFLAQQAQIKAEMDAAEARVALKQLQISQNEAAIEQAEERWSKMTDGEKARHILEAAAEEQWGPGWRSRPQPAPIRL